MMLDTVVDIPTCTGHIVLQKKCLCTYVLFTVSRSYNSKTKKSNPVRVTIGKVCPDNPCKMIPNERFSEFFPNIDLNLPNVEDKSKKQNADTSITASVQASNLQETLNAHSNECQQPLEQELLPVPDVDSSITTSVQASNLQETSNAHSNECQQPLEQELLPAPERADSLIIGPYAVVKAINNDYGLRDCLVTAIGEDKADFTIDIATYLIVTEGNQAQHYPAYAWDHSLFTKNMRIYSDSTISRHLRTITQGTISDFFKAWNVGIAKDKKINISYDSTNKNTQAGDLEFAEFGHAKTDKGTKIINTAIAYDPENKFPLFYEAYPGSIPDVSQLTFAIDMADDLGYENLRFIIDRGYFSLANINYLDEKGYDFVLMVKGFKTLVAPMIQDKIGTFEKKIANQISGDLFGITVHEEFCGKQRYFHIYHSLSTGGQTAQNFLDNIDAMERTLTKHVNRKFAPTAEHSKFFNLNISKGDLISFSRNEKSIEEHLGLCGYFAIVTSEPMDAKTAYKIYSNRDGSEKLFCFGKSFIGGNSYRIHSDAALRGKMFIEFIALILRSRMYSLLKDELLSQGKSCKYLNVPAAIRELEKIRITRAPNGSYRLLYGLTKAQKQILSVFGISIQDLIKTSIDVSNILAALPAKNKTPDSLEQLLDDEFCNEEDMPADSESIWEDLCSDDDESDSYSSLEGCEYA
ncbi:transposase [Anaerobiospirillum sp. NML120448]|uniref:IS1634 family transposase n=1 Tax=Anaerobiospirillum sp. NML120448 TaxID=2932816 RepID=UPI001FF300F5|nr:transposase [Anaerobiospirillum sp. NML120448]MCK0515565.1 transposase [Anaerobiospirillum sp. NML120448]